ncbi:hypothetical protein [Frigoribacterium sp. CFBP9030]|uniref:hypothetical protein n=1 Tax=Frigoribacterium sp. CFBP9030 TaxID=3096537 RepID=UPI002A6A79A7|nr:hypothetical protein [Frigoribacterium sp. CFBP9030]MDY0891853.1 hypothetical protein [Frigoribacterium sp. CFBP9030]
MNDFDVEVKTWLPSSHYKRLYGVAQATNTEVSSLVRELVRRQLESAPHVRIVRVSSGLTTEVEARLRELHAQGLSDVAIGAQLDISNKTVGLYRNQLGLAKTSKQGRPKKQSNTLPRDNREQATEGDSHE